MATIWPCTENLGRELDVNHALFSTMRGKPDNGRALALAQLTRGTAYVVALRGRADNHSAARWGNSVLCLR